MRNKAFDDLFPGMASVMEDVNVETSVEVGTPEEVAEEISEAETNAEEVTEVAAESETTEETAEMILNRYEEWEHTLMHVSTYGVDRSFISLMNKDNVLGRVLRIDFPSCESFDATGDPKSELSNQVMEGLCGVVESVWNWIKEMCRKIKEFLGRMWEAIMSRIQNVDKRIGTLRAALKGKFNKEKAKNSTATIFGVDTLTKFVKAIEKAESHMVSACQKAAKAVGKLKADEKGEGELNEKQSKKAAEVTALAQMQKELKADAPVAKMGNAGSDYLKLAERGRAGANGTKKYIDEAKKNAEELAAKCDQMEKQGKNVDKGTGFLWMGKSVRQKARMAMAEVNLAQSYCTTVIRAYDWLAARAVSAGLTFVNQAFDSAPEAAK